MNKNDLDSLGQFVAKLRMHLFESQSEVAAELIRMFPAVEKEADAYRSIVAYPEFRSALYGELARRQAGADWAVARKGTERSNAVQEIHLRLTKEDEMLRLVFGRYLDMSDDVSPNEETIGKLLASPEWAVAVDEIADDYGQDLSWLKV